MQILARIGGVDVTNYVRLDTIEIEAVQGQRVSTCSLIVDDTGGLISTWELQEIIISNPAETERHFAGYIANATEEMEGILPIRHLECQDYTMLLEMAMINKVYENQTDLAIIQAAFSASLPEINTASISSLKTIDLISLNYKSLRAVLDMLADITGAVWYVDYSKVLHYGLAENSIASFELSDAPDLSGSYPYYDFSRAKDATGVINRVTVQGGYYKGDDVTKELPNDGTNVIVPLPYTRFHSPTTNPTRILVWKNDGTDAVPSWTSQTVGLDGVDNPASYNCLFNFGSSFLRFATAPPNLKLSIRAQGREVVPILARVRSQASYDSYGRWFDKLLVDKDISSKDEAEDKGYLILNEQAFAKEVIKLKTNQGGLVVGQSVKLTHSKLSISQYYTISRVRTVVWRGAHAEYHIEMARSQPNDDLVDNLVELNRKVNYSEIREDEVLNEYFELIESLSFGDGKYLSFPYTFPFDFACIELTARTGPYYCEATPPSNTIRAGYWKCGA